MILKDALSQFPDAANKSSYVEKGFAGVITIVTLMWADGLSPPKVQCSAGSESQELCDGGSRET